MCIYICVYIYVCIYIYKTESFCSTPETNIVNQLYSNIK